MTRLGNGNAAQAEAWLRILAVVLLAGIYSALAGGCAPQATSILLLSPTISSVTPSKGPIVGGTVVTITGTNFQTGASVTIGGAAATVQSVNATQIVAVTPAHAQGAVTVAVTNPDMQSASAANAYTYIPPPPTLNSGTVLDGTTLQAYTPVTYTCTDGSGGTNCTVSFVGLGAGACGGFTGSSSANTGTVAGSPAAAGSCNFQAVASDPFNQTTNLNQTIQTFDPVAIADTDLQFGVGVSATHALSITGGNGTISCAEVGQNGQVSVTAACQLTGSPQSGSGPVIQVNIQATSPTNPPRTVTKAINAHIAEITTPTVLPDAIVGQVYSQQTTATGFITSGGGTASWSSTNGPPGVSVSGMTFTGSIGGTPRLAGTYTFDANVGNISGTVTSKRFQLTVHPGLLIQPPTATVAVNSTVQFQAIAISDLSQPTTGPPVTSFVSWSLAPNTQATISNAVGTEGLATGLLPSPPDEIVTATAPTGASATATLTVTAIAPLTITTTQMECGVGNPNVCIQPIQVSNGTAPFTFSATGLPAWFSLNPATGVASGTPPPGSGGKQTFTATVGDALQQSVTAPIDLFVPEITNVSFAAGFVGQTYSDAVAAIGTPPNSTFNLAPGTSLPSGLNLDVNSGAITGTAAQATTATFNLRVGLAGFAEKTVQITIHLGLVITPKPASVQQGQTIQLQAFSIPDLNSKGTPVTDLVQWSSSDTNIATISNAVGSEGLASGVLASSNPVVISATLPLTGAMTQVLLTVTPPPSPPGVLFRVNVINQILSNDECTSASGTGISISSDGSTFFVAATCRDNPNHASDDTNGVADGWLFEGKFFPLGSTSAELVSRGPTGTPGNGPSTAESLTTCPTRFTQVCPLRPVFVFTGAANNLTTPGSSQQQVYTQQSPPVMISVSTVGTPGNSFSTGPVITPSARYVAFASASSNLVTGDTNGKDDIFLRDTCQGVASGCTPSTILISMGAGGVPANDRSTAPSISEDARYIAFQSDASNLVSGDTNNTTDIFVFDRDADADGIFDEPGATSMTRVSVADDGSEGNGASQEPVLSADGRVVVFSSQATNFAAGTSASFASIYLHDRDTDADGIFDEPGAISTTLVSASDTGTPSNTGSSNPTVSADGRYVAFDSFADNLVTNDTPFSIDVFAVDTCFGAPAGCTRHIVLVSQTQAGVKGDGDSLFSSISADGRFVVFSSRSTNLVSPYGRSPSAFIFDVYVACTGFGPCP